MGHLNQHGFGVITPVPDYAPPTMVHDDESCVKEPDPDCRICGGAGEYWQRLSVRHHRDEEKLKVTCDCRADDLPLDDRDVVLTRIAALARVPLNDGERFKRTWSVQLPDDLMVELLALVGGEKD